MQSIFFKLPYRKTVMVKLKKSLTNSGKADSNRSFLANFTEEFGFGVFGDVMSHFKVSKGT